MAGKSVPQMLSGLRGQSSEGQLANQTTSRWPTTQEKNCTRCPTRTLRRTCAWRAVTRCVSTTWSLCLTFRAEESWCTGFPNRWWIPQGSSLWEHQKWLRGLKCVLVDFPQIHYEKKPAETWAEGLLLHRLQDYKTLATEGNGEHKTDLLWQL